MNDQPLITVIIPIYKVEPYLHRCVDSVMHQTYQNQEIILVDDGSPDRCGEICDEYAGIDSRIRVIHKANGGLADARNAALPEAGGAYICFIDSDDWVTPYYVEHLYDALVKDAADMSSSWFENVLEPANISEPVSEIVDYSCLDSEDYLRKMLYQDGVETSAWGKLYRADIIKELRYPVGKLYEDIPVTYAATKRCRKIALVGNVDYYYFQRTDGIQNAAFNPCKMDGVTHCGQMMKEIRADYPDLYQAAKCRYLSTVFNIIFQIRDTNNQERNDLWMEIKKYRKDVLLDHNARKKTRIAALLSYAGLPVVTAVYNRTQWRGKNR